MKCLAIIFANFSPHKNNHVYSIFIPLWHCFSQIHSVLSFLVRKGKLDLKRNIELEDEEAQRAMDACIEALKSMGKGDTGTMLSSFETHNSHNPPLHIIN